MHRSSLTRVDGLDTLAEAASRRSDGFEVALVDCGPGRRYDQGATSAVRPRALVAKLRADAMVKLSSRQPGDELLVGSFTATGGHFAEHTEHGAGGPGGLAIR